MLPAELLQRLETIEAAVFQPTTDQGSGLPLSDSLPTDLEISVTASLEGAYVILSWGNWQHTIKGYEIWLERPDGSNELAKTVQYSPATLTVVTDTAAPFIFKIRPIMATGEEISIERAPAIAATIPVPVVESADIANNAVQTQHIANLAVTDAKILTLTANKLTAGTINAAIISVINLNASNINTGTLNASVVNVTNLNASNIVTGTLTSINISAGTYSLISGSNQMSINGTNGFRQYNSSSGRSVRLFNGQFEMDVDGSSVTPSQLTLRSQTFAETPRLFLRGDGGSGGYIDAYVDGTNSNIPGVIDIGGTGARLEVNGQQVVAGRLAAITAPAGGATIDTQARTAINTIISRLQTHGLTS